MKRNQHVITSALLPTVCLFVGIFATAAQADEKSTESPPPAYNGKWVRAEAIEKALGYSGSRRTLSMEGILETPETIEIKMDRSPNQEVIELTRDFLKNAEQQATITGRFRFGELKPTMCVVAHHKGGTYLWHGAAFVGIMNTRISLVPGAKKDRDLLIVEWFPDMGHKTPAVAAYRRAAE